MQRQESFPQAEYAGKKKRAQRDKVFGRDDAAVGAANRAAAAALSKG